MKALFIHDHPFIRNQDTGVLYTSGNLNSELWDRYLRHFESITVIGRCRLENDTSRYHKAEKVNVVFNLFNDVRGGIDYFKKRDGIEKRLIEEIDRHEIIIMRFPATISAFAAQYCIRNNIPYVAEVVGCAWDANWNYGGVAAKLIAPYSFLQMKKSVKHALAAIYVTERFLQKRYPTHAKIIAAASNVILSKVQEDVLEKRIEKIIRYADPIHIGIIGNISVRYKGYDVLLRAIKRLTEPLQNRVKISFVGGGNESYLKGLLYRYGLEDQAQIVGKLRAGQPVLEFIDSLDLYVHPSKQEGLPRVVIEAMSRACPVVASSVAGTPELISENYLHKPGDYKKLAKDVEKVISNVEVLKKMAAENFEQSKAYLFAELESRRNVFFENVKIRYKCREMQSL